MRAVCFIALALASCIPAGVATAGGAPKAAGHNICGIGILAPSGKVLVLPSASGGIETVALHSGKALWESSAAAKPLLVTDDKVFAQAAVKGKKNQVKLVVLDAVTGERLAESEVISFPEWASVERDYGLSFRSAAHLEKGGLVYVWEARAFYEGGVPPPDFGPDGKPYKDPNAKEDYGAFRMNLSNGKLEAVRGYLPKDAEFTEMHPTSVGNTKRQNRVFRVEETGPDPAFPHTLTRRVLIVETLEGQRAWTRPIAGDIYLPPRP